MLYAVVNLHLPTTVGVFFQTHSNTVVCSYSRMSYDLVGLNGLGPSTSRLSGGCSNQLSYKPVLVEISGVEPLTPCLQGRCSTN